MGERNENSALGNLRFKTGSVKLPLRTRAIESTDLRD